MDLKDILDEMVERLDDMMLAKGFSPYKIASHV